MVLDVRDIVLAYAKKQYDSEAEYLWKKDFTSCVLRHKKNGKWYAIFMEVSGDKLGLETTKTVSIMDVKAEPDEVAFLTQTEGIYPGYHMNKKHWLTILLDGSVDKEKVLDFLDRSYDLVDQTKRKMSYGYDK